VNEDAPHVDRASDRIKGSRRAEWACGPSGIDGCPYSIITEG